MRKKLQSPVVWTVLLGEIVAQIEILQHSTTITWGCIVIAICAVLGAFFGALNNPNDRDNF